MYFFLWVDVQYPHGQTEENIDTGRYAIAVLKSKALVSAELFLFIFCSEILSNYDFDVTLKAMAFFYVRLVSINVFYQTICETSVVI